MNGGYVLQTAERIADLSDAILTRVKDQDFKQAVRIVLQVVQELLVVICGRVDDDQFQLTRAGRIFTGVLRLG
jgi:hypothetical protein